MTRPTYPAVIHLRSRCKCIYIEVTYRLHHFIEAEEIETWTCTGLNTLVGRKPLCEEDRWDAGDVRSVDLAGDHENADFHRLTALIDSVQKHVEAALVGAERVEEERQLEQALCIRRQ